MLKSKLSFALAFSLLFTASAPLFGQAPAPASKERVDQLVAVIKSADAQRKAKADACRELAHIGTADCIPALAAMLSDEQNSHMARYGLETIPSPAVDEAFRAALGQLKGNLLAGVIGSIGVRRDVKAIDPVAKFLTDADPFVAQAAARALGKIGTAAAAKAIQANLAQAPAGNKLAFYEGLFRCAEAMLAQKQSKEAIAIYDKIRADAPSAHQVRAGALRGAILARGEKAGVPLLREGLKSADFILVDAAVRTAMELPGAEVTKALSEELNGLKPDQKLLVIQVMGKRKDAAAVPALAAAAKTGDKITRMAAIRAMPEIGGATIIQPLITLLGDADRELVAAAMDGLAGTAGKEADAAVEKILVSGDANQRLCAVDLVGRRKMANAGASLLKAAQDTDPKVRPAALKKMGEVGSTTDIPALLALMSKSKDSQDTAAAEQALSAICARAENPQAAAAPIFASLAQSQGQQKSALLSVVGGVGGAEALKAVRAAVADTNPEIRAAAIRTMGEWKTAEAGPDLLALAQNAANPTDKMLSLRSYLGLAGLPDVAADQRLAMCEKAVALIQRPEEKKLLLGTLGGIPTPEAVAMILPYLDDAATKDEAGAAIIAIADKVMQRRTTSKLAPQLVAPLQKVIEKAGNAGLIQRAKTLLEQAQKAPAK